MDSTKPSGSSKPSRPSLTTSFVPASEQTSRVMTNVESPPPHLGWHSRGYLPHWDHPGMIQSLNFRLGDSLPEAVLEKWKQELELTFLGAPASRRHKTASNLRHETSWRDASAPRNEDERKRVVELRIQAGSASVPLASSGSANISIVSCVTLSISRTCWPTSKRIP